MPILHTSHCTHWIALLVLALSVHLRDAQAATLTIRVVEKTADGREKSLPCRVHLSDHLGQPQRAPGLPFFRDHFVCAGTVDLELQPGIYRYTVERGPEYRRRSGKVELVAEKNTEVNVTLARWIDLATRGWWSGETHVHRPLEELGLLLRAEDLHVAPVLTVWNRRNLWRGRSLPEQLSVEVEPTRVYHVLACEDERRGGALLYFNLGQPLDLRTDTPEYPSPVTHLREALEQRDAWVEIEKPFWWDVPTWVATGKIRSLGLANNHMCRSTMYANEAWGRPRDEKRLPPPRGNGFYTQEIYYRLLNCGFRIPPSAGSASGVLPNPVGYNRVYVHLDGPFSYEAWWKGLAAGRSFVTNGPVLLVEANGRLPGETFRSPGGTSLEVRLDVRVGGNDPLEALEVVRDGRVVERIGGEEVESWTRPWPLVFKESGWFLIRAITRVPETFRFASTAPFYVEIGGERSTVRRADVEYFLGWIDERIETLQSSKSPDLAEPGRRESVLAPHREARRVFAKLLE